MRVLPKISFVVPLFNHLAETREMLASLQASLPTDLEYEIVLVDDGSSDGTRDWLQGLQGQGDARIRVHLNEHNRGYAATNNVGAGLARGELLGLLNNDLLFEPGWLEPMLEVLLSPDLNAGLVGNVQYRVADGAVDHAGVVLTHLGQFDHLHAVPASDAVCVQSLVATGACLLIRKLDFDGVGGFDESYVNGCEDIDLGLKIRRERKRIYVATQSRIRHHVSLSRNTKSSQNDRNSRLLFTRWRKEIKQELSAVWRALLSAGPAAYADKLSGELVEGFLKTPHAASRVIAEAMLRREEARWSRDLDEVAGDAELANRVTVRGLRYSPEHQGNVLKYSAEFQVDDLNSARNFYVCGWRIDDLTWPVTLTIEVNGLQTQTFSLNAERNINVGMVDPIVLPGVANCFRVETDGAMVVTHIVVDDRVVDL